MNNTLKLLFIDTETTSLNIATAQTVEFAWIKAQTNAWDTPYPSLDLIAQGSFLIQLSPDTLIPNETGNEKSLPEEIFKVLTVSGINTHLIMPDAPTALSKTAAFEYIKTLCNEAHVLIAHNGVGYDFPILDRELKTYTGLNLPSAHYTSSDVPLDFAISLIKRPDRAIHLDTTIHPPDDLYPPENKSRSLKYLAADFDILLTNAHRAGADTQTLFNIFGKMIQKNDNGRTSAMHRILTHATSQTITVRAFVSFDNKDKAKKLKFTWEPLNPENPVAKAWIKKIPEVSLPELMEKINGDFKVEILPAPKNSNAR
jgi:hypothetical protein